MSSKHRYVLLDGLRAIAALAVVLYHFSQHGGGATWFFSAPLAVDFFFCLSGFVIAYAYQERIAQGLGLVAFLKKRLWRLYPAYLVGCVLGLVALLLKYQAGQTDFSLGQIAAAAGLNLFYLPYVGAQRVDVFHEPNVRILFPLNDPAWSLFFEFVANVLFFFVVRGRRGWPLLCVVLSGIALVVTTKILGKPGGWDAQTLWGGLPRVGFAFFSGVVLYQYRGLLVRLPRLPAVLLAIVLVAALAVPAVSCHTSYWLAMALLFVPLLVAFSTRCELAAGSWLERGARYGGALSYPLYCVHFPILLLVSLFAGDGEVRIFFLIGGVTAALVVAHGVHRWLEQPLQQRRFP